MTHPGIRLRIAVPAGVLVEGDSDLLYFSAKFGTAEPCRPDCMAGCSEHGWVSLIGVEQGLGLMQTWPEVPIRIEIKPVLLADEQDQEEDGDGCAGGDCHRGRAAGPVRRRVAGALARAAAAAGGRGGGVVRGR